MGAVPCDWHPDRNGIIVTAEQQTREHPGQTGAQERLVFLSKQGQDTTDHSLSTYCEPGPTGGFLCR